MRVREPEHVYWRRRFVVLFVVVWVISRGVAFAAGIVDDEEAAATRSWYVSWLQRDDAEERAEDLGCEEARRTPGGTVFLGFGRQREGGPSGFRSGSVPYVRVAAVTAAYGRGLLRCGDDEWVVAAMTSNHKLTDAALAGRYGEEWGAMVQLAAELAGDPSRVVFAAGSDVEPAWGPFDAARAWSLAVRKSGARAAYTPSADGCPVAGATACANGWNVHQMAELMWGIDPQAVVMPQIYKETMARQWGRIAAAAAEIELEPRFAGALTQRGACVVTKQRPCLDAGPVRGRAMLAEHTQLRIPAGSDISW